MRFSDATHDDGESLRGEAVRHLSGVRLSANSMSVNLRHAAALTLLGWYMILTDNPLSPSPFSKDTILMQPPPIFKTKEECELGKMRWLLRRGQAPDGYWLMCIASDDPRLKEK